MCKIPVKRARRFLGESDSQMWLILFAHVNAAHARLSLDSVLWVGANKINPV
jgi:hypothetical protein